jgi:aminodeoxychorismate lyase
LKIGIDNRAFRYGDGIFESIRMSEGKIPLWTFHFERLKEGMKTLRMDIPVNYSADYFRSEIEKLTGIEGNFRIRLSVNRSDGGFYTPISDVPNFLIEVIKTDTNHFPKYSNGLTLGWYDEAPILSNTRLAGIKSANALPYVLAAQHRKTYHLDDCLIFNEKGNIAEAVSSNVFFIKDERLITPHLRSGCVAGVMRRSIIEIAKGLGIKVKEQIAVHPKHIFKADGIFLTNAIQGIRWVKKVEYTEFPYPEMIDKLQEEINTFSCL